MPSTTAVLQDLSEEKDANGQPLPAFRFLGVRVQRRTISSEGKASEWAPLDLESTYKPYIVLSGKRFEADDPAIGLISFPGLVMPRLPLFQETQYPAVEKQVPNLEKTIAKLTEKPPAEIMTPGRYFDVEKFDIFAAAAGGEATGRMAGGPGAMAAAGRPPLRTIPVDPLAARRPGLPHGPAGAPGAAGVGTAGNQPADDESLPDYCLVRLIDATIEPGKTYQYRLQVRMANPNYGKKDVASPNYARDRELVSDQWYEVPTKVVVPPELLFYAVDQKDLDTEYKGPFAKEVLQRGRQVAMQIHKWVENAAGRGNAFIPVGEWSVAERLPVFRGEYIGGSVRVELPVWKPTREEFVLITDNTTKRSKAHNYPVDFSLSGTDPILVDFEGGDQFYERVVRRTEDKPETTRIRDKSAVEVLILSPDGKLLSRDSAADANDEQRKVRLDEVRTRVKDVREGKTGEKDKKNPMASPFNK
jgi:hypothetical protein